MLDGHNGRLRAENSATMRSWRALSPERRLAAIERRLNPANSLGDGYPPAL